MTHRRTNRTTRVGNGDHRALVGGGGGRQRRGAGVTPKSTRVAVLNGTTIGGPRLQGQGKLRTAGYTGKVTTGNNTDQQRAESSVMYGTRDGPGRSARTVARRLDISTVQRDGRRHARPQRERGQSS